MKCLTGCLLNVSLLTAILAAAEPAASPAPFPAEGLASRYVGDVGIERDPQVIFAENFEEASPEALWSRWEDIGDKPGMSFADDRPPGNGGHHSLLMERTQGPGAKLYTRLRNKSGGFGHDRVFARYYVKFDRDCGEIHHFGTCLGGNLPATPWPSVKAGYPTDGAKSFWSGIEPFGSAWTWDFYTYWCEMRGSPPRGQTWGNSFIRDPRLKVEKDRWVCVEQMIRMNTPGDTDGEQALWLDGRLVAHLGKGFPEGLWTYDKFTPGQGGESIRWSAEKSGPERSQVPAGGEPFAGYRWRTVPELNVNYVWLYIFTQKPAGHRMKVWFDDVVVATSYIGPIRAK
jgi:hypothetical protein